MIANRLEKSLERIISKAQTGFMKQRRIAVNIRRIFELMTYTQNHNIDAMILSLDFMKCFDKIEKTAILGSLHFFEFSQYLIDWVDIIYTDFKAKIQNNGHFTDIFDIEKGVHQGGPASSLLFLICAEVLAIQLRKTAIPGIPVDEISFLLGQFADDMDICSPPARILSLSLVDHRGTFSDVSL